MMYFFVDIVAMWLRTVTRSGTLSGLLARYATNILMTCCPTTLWCSLTLYFCSSALGCFLLILRFCPGHGRGSNRPCEQRQGPSSPPRARLTAVAFRRLPDEGQTTLTAGRGGRRDAHLLTLTARSGPLGRRHRAAQLGTPPSTRRPPSSPDQALLPRTRTHRGAVGEGGNHARGRVALTTAAAPEGTPLNVVGREESTQLGGGGGGGS